MTEDKDHLLPPPEHRLPDFLYPLFWDCDSTALDTDQHAAFIQGRIMERGSWAAMQWLLRRYGQKKLADFLLTKGCKTLAARELNYWALLCDISPMVRQRMVQCTTAWSGIKK